MRMKRGANSMRVRRRQSDAKWRASVSSCYDTLKFVIPDSCNLPRRKFSKALILQETAKHIKTLEEAVSTLLTQEAKLLNKSVLWKTGKQWTPATLAHIRKEFEEQQGQLFEQSTQGRRRYSMLADIEEQILHMSVDPSNVTVISLGGGVQDKASKTGNSKDKGKEACVRRKAKILTKESTKVYEEPQAHSTPCPKKQRKHSHSVNIHDFETHENIPVICERVPNADLLPSIALRPDYKYDMSHDVPLSTPSKLCYHGNEELFSPVVECGFNTPVYMNPNPHRVDTKPQITSPRFSKVTKQLEFTSEDDPTLRPSCHHDKMSEMTSVFGFTPIKLLPEPGTMPFRLPHDQVTQATPTIQAAQGLTPAFQRNSYPPQTPKSDGDCLESGDEETKSLLCFETFEMVSDDDAGVPDWERTPDKIKHCEQTSPVEEGGKKDQCKRKIAFGKGTNKTRKSRDRIPKCRKNLEKLYETFNKLILNN
ncbi:uncharacterized protein LOC124288308 [Haliotis rubra]|uniref:uncharacterized protein LOC124288308 n=1 Tax=Haliotis rubra TaxID=36100 RepID=UPI001EE55558|nr:uncharacterized protein LOC124288308 [Haliotis rubra]